MSVVRPTCVPGQHRPTCVPRDTVAEIRLWNLVSLRTLLTRDFPMSDNLSIDIYINTDVQKDGRTEGRTPKVRTHRRTNARKDGLTEGRTHERMSAHKDGRTEDGSVEGRSHESTDALKNGRTRGRTDAQNTDARMCRYTEGQKCSRTDTRKDGCTGKG